jgi:hypothetical protein
MTDYVDTQGTDLKIGNGASPEVFTSIPQIVSIDGPSSARSEKTVTHLKSTAVETSPGLRDFGSLNLEVEWDEGDTVHAGLRTKFDAGTYHNFQLVDAGSPTKRYSFRGWVKSIPQKYGIDAVVMASVEIRLTSAMTVS